MAALTATDEAAKAVKTDVDIDNGSGLLLDSLANLADMSDMMSKETKPAAAQTQLDAPAAQLDPATARSRCTPRSGRMASYRPGGAPCRGEGEPAGILASVSGMPLEGGCTPLPGTA